MQLQFGQLTESAVSSKFQIGDLVSAGNHYGRVASVEDYRRDLGKEFFWPDLVFGKAVIFFDGTVYYVAAEPTVRKIDSPQAEILAQIERRDKLPERLRSQLYQRIQANIESYKRNLYAQIRAIQDAIPRKIKQHRAASEKEAAHELSRTSATLKEETQRNIEYLEQIIRAQPHG